MSSNTTPAKFIFDAVTIVRRGKLSKQHISHRDSVPIKLRIEQEEIVEVLLLERDSSLLSDLDKTGGPSAPAPLTTGENYE